MDLPAPELLSPCPERRPCRRSAPPLPEEPARPCLSSASPRSFPATARSGEAAPPPSRSRRPTTVSRRRRLDPVRAGRSCPFPAGSRRPSLVFAPPRRQSPCRDPAAVPNSSCSRDESLVRASARAPGPRLRVGPAPYLPTAQLLPAQASASSASPRPQAGLASLSTDWALAREGELYPAPGDG